MAVLIAEKWARNVRSITRENTYMYMFQVNAELMGFKSGGIFSAVMESNLLVYDMHEQKSNIY